MTTATAAQQPVGPAPVPPSRMRRAVIRSVTASAAVPQFSVEADVDAAGLRELRHALRPRIPALSVADLLHLAVARTVADHPLLNSSHTDAGVVTHPAVNLAFIVEVADGLLTPAIRDAGRRTLADLAHRPTDRPRLADAADPDRTGES